MAESKGGKKTGLLLLLLLGFGGAVAFALGGGKGSTQVPPIICNDPSADNNGGVGACTYSHKECQNNKCVIIQTKGNDSCTGDFQCGCPQNLINNQFIYQSFNPQKFDKMVLYRDVNNYIHGSFSFFSQGLYQHYIQVFRNNVPIKEQLSTIDPAVIYTTNNLVLDNKTLVKGNTYTIVIKENTDNLTLKKIAQVDICSDTILNTPVNQDIQIP